MHCHLKCYSFKIDHFPFGEASYYFFIETTKIFILFNIILLLDLI